MNRQAAQLLEKHFDTAFAAPDGIKKLRELILTLAMQGKLVPQDPQDQPASELLKEIEAEKKRLVKEGKIKQPKQLPNITPEEMPYSLPECWKWVRLNDVLDVRDGTHDTPKYVDVGFPLITSKNLYTGKLSFEDVKYISTEDHSKISDRSKVDVGDILFAMIGSIGNPVIVDSDEEFSIKNVALFKFYQTGKPDNRFLHFFLIYAQENMKATSSGAVQSFVSLGFLRNYLFPLPPLAEQLRIVAKIDQLLARCDELESLRAEREQMRVNVHTSAINRLLYTQENNNFDDAWQFIAKHFFELYSVKENVAELRKAILQLAVMGKLVPQDPKEQPASELLKNIEAEKKRLVKEGKIKAGSREAAKSVMEIKPEEIPYQVPKGWEWVVLGKTIYSMDAGWSPKCENEPANDGEWGVLKTTAVQPLRFWLHENKALPQKLDPRPDTQVFENDILITRAGPKNRVGICCVAKPVRPLLMLSDKIIRFRIIGDLIYSEYCALSLNTGFGADQIEKMKSGMADSQVNISQDKLKQVIIGLPPLPEQRRIVTKLDQLMAMCDELDKQIDASTQKQTTLLNAVMAQL